MGKNKCYQYFPFRRKRVRKRLYTIQKCQYTTKFNRRNDGICGRISTT